MQYSGELAQIQQAASRTADYAARRAATFAALSPSPGEVILEVGCGSGLFTCEVAKAIGSAGQAHAIDASDDQVAAARSICQSLDHAHVQVGSALALPYPSAVFDAAASIQVLEYIADVELALAEQHRVLKPGGRFVNFATNWGTLFWNSRSPDRTRQVLNAWDAHAPYPNLPATLRCLLVGAGFSDVQQSPVSILNTTYDAETYSFWLARLIAAFVVAQQLVPQSTATAWLDDLAEAQAYNEYMFCSMAVVTRASRS
jgi:arsenite methyltransferase